MSDSVSNRAETLSPKVQHLVPHDRPHAGFWGLTLGAIGVVSAISAPARYTLFASRCWQPLVLALQQAKPSCSVSSR
jgi:hypothetical protein